MEFSVLQCIYSLLTQREISNAVSLLKIIILKKNATQKFLLVKTAQLLVYYNFLSLYMV